MYVSASGTAPLGSLTRTGREVSDAWSSLFGERLVFCRNGRQALLAGLRAIGAGPPRRIWMPAYLEDVVAAPVARCGLEMRFYDVTDALGPEEGLRLAAPDDLLLVVHYFGLVAPAFMGRDGRPGRAPIIIEDCAHVLPDADARVRAGSRGDLAFFSLRKQLPVPDGGILVVNSPAVPLPVPGPRARGRRWSDGAKLAALALDWAAFRSGRNPIGLKDRIRSGRPSNGHDGVEIEEMSPVTRRMMTAMNLVPRIRRKKANYVALAGRLSGIRRIEVPVPALADGSVPQMLPILVDNPQAVCGALRRMGVEACRWPLRGIRNLPTNEYPMSRRWAGGVVLLPVHESLADRHLDWIARAVARAV